MHEHFRRTFGWYDRWHNYPHSSAVSWGILLAFALIFTFGLLSAIERSYPGIAVDTQVSLAVSAKTHKVKAASEGPIVERLRTANDAVLVRANEHAHAASGQERPTFDALKVALTERQKVITELALTNPKEVRRFLFDKRSIESIPTEARDLVEKPVTAKGVYHLAGAEEFTENGKAYEEYVLEVSPHEHYRMALTDEEVNTLEPESTLTVTGMNTSGDILVPTEFVEPNSTDGMVLGASTVKKVAIVAFNFLNNTSQPITTDELKRKFFTNTDSVNAYYKEISNGQWEIQGRDHIDGDVYGWVTINANTGTCDYSGWVTLANQALSAQGVNLTGYTNVQYVFPGTGSGCGWVGLGYVNGGTTWVVGESFRTHVSGHELGHNFGFQHASSYGCGVASSIAGTCTPSEYGDQNDIMGAPNPRHTNTYNKSKYWLQPAQIVTATAPGTYTIEPSETNTTGIKAVRIKRPFMTGGTLISDGYDQLECRTPYSFDNYAPTDQSVTGVTVRLVGGNYLSGAQKTYWVNTVTPGNTLTDTEGGISISAISSSPSGVVVNVSMPSVPCRRYNPTVTLAPSSQWGTAGNSLSYTLSVTNNDSTECSASTFSGLGTLSSGFVQSPTAPSLTLNPGETRSMTLTVSAPLSAMPASYIVTESVSNSNAPESVGTVSANFNIAAPDATAPVISVLSPKDGSSISGRKVSVSATASDASGIQKIDLYIDNKLMKTCTGVTGCTYSWSISKVSSGSHTIRVVAVDASVQRNLSETQITVKK